MESQLATSNTIIGSLCRETEKVRSRSLSIISALNNCNDIPLFSRLNNELEILRLRRLEILKTALTLKKDINQDNLSINFLIEISKRGLA